MRVCTGRRRALVVTCLLVLGYDAAMAQDAADTAEPDAGGALEPRSVLYETATVVARPLEEATASVTVLDRETIDAMGVVTVGDLMRQLVGVDLTTNGSSAGIATAQIRGGDPNFTLVLVDGVPLNDATDLFGGSVNLASLPVSHIERIELVRGPVSSFYGSTGLAGAIHIITRKPQGEHPVTRLAASAGNADFLQAAASVVSGAGPAPYSVGATWIQEDERIADESFEQFQVQGTAAFRLGHGARLDLSGRAASWNGEDYPDASGGPVYGTGETRSSDHEEFSLGSEWTFGSTERAQRLSAKLYVHDLSRESPGVPPSVPPSVERTDYTRAQASWEVPVHRAPSAEVTVGLAVDREDGENDSTLFFPPVLGGPIDGSYAMDRTTGAAFADLVGRRGALTYDVSTRVDIPEGFDTEVSARAGIGYKLGDGGPRLRASAGRAFKLPSFVVLASPPALGGNPDLVPEIALGVDLGIEHSFGAGRVVPSFTLFANRFEDLIDFDFGTFAYVNRSEVTSRGAEAAVDWRPSSTTFVHANVTYQDVDNEDTGETLRQRPRWIGGARFVWNAHSSVRVEVDGQGVSDRADQQIPVPALDTVDGYILFGTAVAWHPARAWELAARIDNLADEDYETLIGFPGPGRSFRLTVGYEIGAAAPPSAARP